VLQVERQDVLGAICNAQLAALAQLFIHIDGAFDGHSYLLRENRVIGQTQVYFTC
jgi:hypothetical protein